MIDGSEKRNRQLAFELENSHVCEKHSNTTMESTAAWKLFKKQLVPPSLASLSDFSSAIKFNSSSCCSPASCPRVS